MTTMLETESFTHVDTHSVKRTAFDIEVRPIASNRMAIATSATIQPASTGPVVPDFQHQYGPRTLRRLDRPQGRFFLVRVVDQSKPQCSALRTTAGTTEKHQEHRRYLQRVSTEGNPPLITPEVAKKSWNLWLAVRKAIGTAVPIPSAGTGPDGQMFYSWDRGDHHFEAEIYPDRDAAELFYRNRKTNELWGDDYAGGALPREAVEILKMFV